MYFWKCKLCGIDICSQCKESGQLEAMNTIAEPDNIVSNEGFIFQSEIMFIYHFGPKHEHSWLLLCCFSAEEMRSMEQFVDAWSEVPIETAPAEFSGDSRGCEEGEVLEMKELKKVSFNAETSHHCHSKGVPVIITGIHTQAQWSPTDLIKRYGSKRCLVDDSSGSIIPYDSTLSDFFSPWCSGSGEMKESDGLLRNKVATHHS